MSNFYDKLRQTYWKMWHQVADRIRRWREATGRNLAKGNVIKAGTYNYKTQEPETPKVQQENETLTEKTQSVEETKKMADELLKDQTIQAKIDESAKQNLGKEKQISAAEAWEEAGRILEEQTKQARVDQNAKQVSEKGDER